MIIFLFHIKRSNSGDDISSSTLALLPNSLGFFNGIPMQNQSSFIETLERLLDVLVKFLCLFL
jgi:hypothetical protein